MFVEFEGWWSNPTINFIHCPLNPWGCHDFKSKKRTTNEFFFFFLLQIPIMANSLFDSSEELTIMKQEVIKDLKEHLPIYTQYFLAAQRKRKHNPMKMSLEDFALDALLHIIQSISLTSPTEMIPVLRSVMMRNYDMPEEIALEVIENVFEHRCDTKIIILAENKMRKHVEGMLKTHSFKEVMEFYRRHLTPRFYEKKNLGQVFTPFPLIDKILDRIPLEIMDDPNSTFFDPSAGMGGFLVALYKRLMITLARAIPDKEKRHAHIVSKMLFAAELTKNNVHRMKKIFGSSFHVYEGNSLLLDKEKMKKHFGVEQMRVVVGNPPFENEQKKDTKKNAGYSVWIEFVNMSLDHWLQKDGVFGMLLPPGWRKASDDKSRTKLLWKKMSCENTPLYIEMFDDKETKSYFNNAVSIRADLVVLRKKKNKTHKTYIIGTDKKIYNTNITKLPFLPNGHITYWKKILTNDQKEGMNVVNSRSVYGNDKKSVRKISDTNFKHNVIHAIHADGKKVFLYTDKKFEEGGFGVSKVIFNGFGGWNKPILDMRGQYGMSNVVFGLGINNTNDGRDMVEFFNKPHIRHLFSNDLIWATSKPIIFWKLFRNVRYNFWNM